MTCLPALPTQVINAVQPPIPPNTDYEQQGGGGKDAAARTHHGGRMRIVPSNPRRKLLSVAALGVSAACVATLAPIQGNASSHREAPLIASTPSLDNTDLYAFVS